MEVVTKIDRPSMRKAADMNDVLFIFHNDERKVRANKTVLSCASEVFRAQFFGPSVPQKAVYVVEDSSVDAFNLFLDILHNVKIDLEELNLEVLGELFHLATKYQIDIVKKAVVSTVKVKNIEMEDVVEAMNVVEKNAHMPEFAHSILENCAKYVLKVSDEGGDILDFFDMFEVKEPISGLLHKLMIKAGSLKNDQETKKKVERKVKRKCKNCKHRICLNKRSLSEENFTKDAVVSSKCSLELGIGTTVKLDGKSAATCRDSNGLNFSSPLSMLRYKCK